MQNLFLSSLTGAERALLQPSLRELALDSQKVLYEMGDTISSVYFPSGMIISLVAVLSTGQSVESAMVGRDDVVGASSALDGKIATSRAVVQSGGETSLCDANAFKQAVLRSPTLLSKVMRHEQAISSQAQQSTACIAAHTIEARLARWLLRARDISDNGKFAFTQEFLAQMLGVQRPSVSVVAHTLQQAGMLSYRRGHIEISNLEALQETSCECYGTIREQYRRLLGNGSH